METRQKAAAQDIMAQASLSRRHLRLCRRKKEEKEITWGKSEKETSSIPMLASL